MSFLTSIQQTDHRITAERATEMISRFRSQLTAIVQPGFAGCLPFSEVFNRAAFESLLQVPGCVAVRAHFGLDEDRQVRLIFMAVDQNNRDIIAADPGKQVILEIGQRCPPLCPKPDPDPTPP